MNVIEKAIHDLLVSRYKDDIYVFISTGMSKNVDIGLTHYIPFCENDITKYVTIPKPEFLDMILNINNGLTRLKYKITSVEANLVRQVIESESISVQLIN